MKVYEIRVSWGFCGTEEWLIEAKSISDAALKAEKRIKRSPRRYEGHEVTRVSEIGHLVK